MPGRQCLRAQIARGAEQVAELDGLIAADTGDRGFAAHIGVDEIVDHAFAELAFVVEHIVRNADLLGDIARVMDILPGAARALPLHRLAMVVELQRDPDDVVSRLLKQGRGDGGIHAARHGDDDARIAGRRAKSKIDHAAQYRRGAGERNAGLATDPHRSGHAAQVFQHRAVVGAEILDGADKAVIFRMAHRQRQGDHAARRQILAAFQHREVEQCLQARV